MKNLSIVEYQKTDFNEASKVMKLAFNAVDQGWTDESSQDYIKDIQENHLILLAKVEAKIVGIFVASKKANALIVDAIGTLPDFMGQGVGTALYESAIQRARNLGCDTVRMITDPTSKAFQWYKRLGFEENGWVEVEKKI